MIRSDVVRPTSDRRARHRQRAEAVDHAGLHVLGEADRRGRGPEDRVLDEDPRHQEQDVVDPGRQLRELVREDEPEQQHEHDRLDQLEDEDRGHPGERDQVAPRDQAVAEAMPDAGRDPRGPAAGCDPAVVVLIRHPSLDRLRLRPRLLPFAADCSSSAPLLGRGPVSERKTSSSDGRCRAMSASPIRCRPAGGPSPTGRPDRRSRRGCGPRLVLVDTGLARPHACEAPRPREEVRAILDVQLEHLAAHLILQFVGRALGDHAAEVDHRDPVGEHDRPLRGTAW